MALSWSMGPQLGGHLFLASEISLRRRRCGGPMVKLMRWLLETLVLLRRVRLRLHLRLRLRLLLLLALHASLRFLLLSLP